ncbi:isochorismate synthase [Candidatus Synechococcus calcipolaris G9]|uniref:Isochorismate synthase n=1 Tax=Candidatus Synechococcus calcipolaris G9 TaxID=1497997 RepID=A0ABT6EXV5_9SYNE|nr:nicotinate phosphoribosyltransferase [Candidatus Synechococcus calcipolaris]MDG2990642.1 isochorismate synthase [Candidatus Synechococcus calcipolaris G9]
MMRFLFEAFTRIFTPRNDHYPATGVQPFSGDRPTKHNAA